MGRFQITRWPGLAVFGLTGTAAVALAFITVNLFSRAMANLSFIERHGWLAVQEGALIQLAGLSAWGALALLAYLAFKIGEVELAFRYFRWCGRVRDDASGKRSLRHRREVE